MVCIFMIAYLVELAWAPPFHKWEGQGGDTTPVRFDTKRRVSLAGKKHSTALDKHSRLVTFFIVGQYLTHVMRCQRSNFPGIGIFQLHTSISKNYQA